MKKCLFRLSFCLCFSRAILAQFDTGQIAGYVHDPSQAVVTGAVVTITNEGNGFQRKTVTNANGYYAVPNLAVGTYSVSEESAGFKKTVQTGIVMDLAATKNFELA